MDGEERNFKTCCQNPVQSDLHFRLLQSSWSRAGPDFFGVLGQPALQRCFQRPSGSIECRGRLAHPNEEVFYGPRFS
jgi:hypothetical protein